MANEVHSSFVDGNNVYIFGEFDNTITTNVIPKLVNLISTESSKKNPTITFYINSVGGYACELFSLLSVISMAKAQGIKIITIVTGIAYSCASMLAVIGDERYIFEYATHLVHIGSTSFYVSTVEQTNRQLLRASKFFSSIIDHYRRNTKLTEDEIEHIFSDDDFFVSAEECVKKGLADKIITNLSNIDYIKKISKKTNKKKKNNKFKKDKSK